MGKKIILKYCYALFALLGAVVVLWQLLMPGYVLLLDWPAGPQPVFSYAGISAFTGAPVTLVIFALQTILPGWLVQKFLLLGLTFALFYLPLKFFPFQKKFGLEYFAALLFALNPFVYERFLAGQWRVIAGYACLWPLLVLAWRFLQTPAWRAALQMFAALLILGMFSVHFLAVGLVLLAVYFLAGIIGGLWQKNFQFTKDFAQKFIGAGCLFLILSSYWLLPYFLKGDSTLEAFDDTHQTAFRTAAGEKVGPLGNVLALHGFWGEDHAWVTQFTLPKDIPVSWPIGLTLLILLMAYFVFTKAPSREKKRLKIFALGALLMGAALAVGTSRSVFFMLNNFLVENVSFWSGFRDSQKWAGVVAIAYVLLASAGAEKLLLGLKGRRTFQNLALIVIFALPLALSPLMLFGFQGQLHTSWYPSEWQEADSILKKDPACKMLFLPWHQYYSLKHNRGMLTANPARNFFACEVVSGHNTELGGISSLAPDVPGYAAVEKSVTSNNDAPAAIEQVLANLRHSGVRYIVFTDDLLGSDLYRYPFLQSAELEKLYSAGGITVFALPQQ